MLLKTRPTAVAGVSAGLPSRRHQRQSGLKPNANPIRKVFVQRRPNLKNKLVIAYAASQDEKETTTTTTTDVEVEASVEKSTADSNDVTPDVSEVGEEDSAVTKAAGSDVVAEGGEAVDSEEEELDWLVEGEEEEQNFSEKLVKTIVEPIKDRPAVRNVLGLVSLYFVGTFLYSTFKVVRKMVSPRAKKRKQVNKNLTVIETLNEYFPSNRDALSPGTLEKIRYVTGFSYDLIFRKYLRYLLNDRKFDADAVSDLLTLKALCQLNDDQVKDIFREISARIFKKYGILMTDTAGLTSDAIMKKAAERAIFSKLLYLAELPEMMTQEEDIANNLSWQIQEIFGATSEDAESLRIKTLSELEAQDLKSMMGGTGGIDDDEDGGEESEEGSLEVEDVNTEG